MRRKRTTPQGFDEPRDSDAPTGRWLLIRFLVVVGVATVILAMIVFAAVVGETIAATLPSERF